MTAQNKVIRQDQEKNCADYGKNRNSPVARQTRCLKHRSCLSNSAHDSVLEPCSVHL